MNPFSKSEALGYGWKATTDNLGLWLAASLMVFLAYGIPQFLQKQLGEGLLVTPMIIGFLGFLLQSWVMVGFFKMTVDTVDQQPVSLSTLFAQRSIWLNYLLGYALYSLIVLIGFVLLIVPGVIWAIKFQFYPYFIVTQGAGPFEALQASSRITNGAKWNLFLLALMIVGINIAGAMLLGVGLLITIPISILATAFVFRKLSPK